MTDKNKRSDFVAYEYLSVYVPIEFEPIYSDMYRNFGWIDNLTAVSMPETPLNRNQTILRFKRDRDIPNRSRLALKQRKCEEALKKIERLENLKSAIPFIVTLTVGLTGAALLTVSIFKLLEAKFVAFSLLALLGLSICLIAYFCVYKNIRNKQISKLTPIIEEQYELVYQLGEEARELFL